MGPPDELESVQLTLHLFPSEPENEIKIHREWKTESIRCYYLTLERQTDTN